MTKSNIRKISLTVSLIFCLFVLFPIAALGGDSKGESKNTIVWRAQSSFMPGLGNHEDPVYFSEIVNKITGGRLKVDMHAAGELVGGFEAIPAASKGKLDLGWGTTLYLMGTLPGLSFTYNSPYINGVMDYITWLWHGGGVELVNELVQSKYNTYWLPAGGPWESGSLWTRKPVNNVDDLKGLKIRSYGLIVDLWNRMGASAITMPMSEVVPALERGVLDGLHMLTPYQTYPARVYDVCKYRLSGSLFAGSGSSEMFINLDSWNELTNELKELVILAAKLTSFRSYEFIIPRNVEWLEKMRESGVVATRADPELERKFLKARIKQAKEWKAKNPIASKLLDSQRAWIKKWREYENLTPLSREVWPDK